ncbi:hypothetical protein D3C81_1094180 [compost metagenome]
MATNTFGEFAEFPAHVLKVLEQQAQMARQDFARRARRHAAGIALEQLHAGNVFQILDALGCRGGGNVLANGGAPDLALFHHRQEQPQGEQVDPPGQAVHAQRAHGVSFSAGTGLSPGLASRACCMAASRCVRRESHREYTVMSGGPARLPRPYKVETSCRNLADVEDANHGSDGRALDQHRGQDQVRAPHRRRRKRLVLSISGTGVTCELPGAVSRALIVRGERPAPSSAIQATRPAVGRPGMDWRAPL